MALDSVARQGTDLGLHTGLTIERTRENEQTHRGGALGGRLSPVVGRCVRGASCASAMIGRSHCWRRILQSFWLVGWSEGARLPWVRAGRDCAFDSFEVLCERLCDVGEVVERARDPEGVCRVVGAFEFRHGRVELAP